ncbi:MAG: C-terminal binding protein [Sphingomonadaceae bacterium]
MGQAQFKVVILDRPSWYVPSLEQEELGKVGAQVVVGWSSLPDAPPEAAWHYPTAMTPEQYSTITSAFVPVSIGTEERLIAMARDADAVLVISARVTGRVIESLPRLRAIGRYGIGVDNVDVEAATRRGIAVVNVPGFCVREVADHVMMLVLAFARKLTFLHGLMRQGVWGRGKASPMPALYSQTLGLLAFGEISREVALRASPFGLTLLAHDPFVTQDTADRYGVTLVSLEELLARSDYLSVHAPLNAKTRHMLSEAEFRRMKPSAVVLNTARGPVVDEEALVKALREGWIAGAGLDVYEEEPLDPTSPLLTMENVLLTPHTAGLSDESQRDSRRRVSRAVAEILAGRWPEGRELYNPVVKERAQA